MKLFGTIKEVVALWMKQNSQDIKITPHTSTTYTAARTFQLPAGNASDELAGTTATQTITNKSIDSDNNTITNIVNADIKSTAAIDRSKLAVGTADHVVINSGTGAFSSEATLAKSRGGAGADMSSVTFPTSGTITTDAGTSTFTNKTIDADGTGNSITNIENADIKAGAAIDRSKFAAGTADHVLINSGAGAMSSEATLAKSRGGAGADMSSVTFPTSGVITTDAGSSVLENKVLEATCALVDTADNTKTIKWNLAAQSAGVDLTITSSAETADRIITVPILGGDQELVFKDLTQTLTAKTLTSPVISGGTIDNCAVGGSTRAAGAFTTLGANSTSTLADIDSDKDFGILTTEDKVDADFRGEGDFNAATTGSVVGVSGSILIGGTGSTSDTDGSSAVHGTAVTQDSVGVNTLIGVRARVLHNSSGTVANAVSIKAEAPVNGGGGTITTSRAILSTGLVEFQDDLIMSNNQPIKFYEATGGGTNYVSLATAAALANDYTVVLPSESCTIVGRDTAGQNVTFVGEDAAATVTFDNVTFEVENTNANQRKITITSDKAGDTTLTLKENLTVGDGFDLTVTAEDAASAVVLDNANFEVENTDATQRNIKITSAKAGNTTLTLEENFSIGNGYDVTITAEDAAGTITLDNCTLEVEDTAGSGHGIKLINADAAASTSITLNESLVVSDGYAVTLAAEDAAGTITLDNSHFEVENTVGAGQLMKLVNTTAGPGAATLSVSGTSGAVNQDVQSTASPSFANVGLSNQGELKLYEQTGNGGNYVGFKAPDAVTGDCAWKLPDGDGGAGTLLSTDGAKNLSWAAGLSTALTDQHVLIGNASNVATATDTELLGDVVASTGSHEVTFDFTGHGDGEDRVLWNAHTLNAWDTVYFTNSGGALPAELSVSTMYYVRDPQANSFGLSLYRNGPALEFTDDGSGTSTVWYRGLLLRRPIYYQIKYLAANTATQGDYLDNTAGNGAFKFTLETGKTYRMSLNLNATTPSGGDVFVTLRDNVTAFMELMIQHSGTAQNSTFGSIIHTMTSTSLRVYLDDNLEQVNGDGTYMRTWLMVEELPYHVANTTW